MAKRSLGFALASLSFIYAAPSSKPLISRSYDTTEIQVDESKHDAQFHTFITRPDLDPPKLNVTVYDEDALAPGYLFVAPYTIVVQNHNTKRYIGPHIYDQTGELIWSGVPFFSGWSTFDFRVAEVNGERMLTTISMHDAKATIMDNTYTEYKTVDVASEGGKVNMHAFAIVDNGTRALYMTRHQESMEFDSGDCQIQFKGIVEQDIVTGETTFEWDSQGHILPEESHQWPGHRPTRRCRKGPLDYIHSNAVQKFPDGDYLLSGRHTYALYKISHKTGEIVWRLGGKKNDFTFDGHFSGQHDAQVLFQNSSHTLISMLDNAHAPARPAKTNPFSRGLKIMLNTDTMVAEQVMAVDHPYHLRARGRGNFETLPNGNLFLAWREDTFLSEHTPDGRMIMEASFPAKLKTYRGFKYPWVGKPTSPPDVHSQLRSKKGNPITVVHVSWNGDTEVASWTLYQTKEDGSGREHLAKAKREGFETALTYPRHAQFVLVEGQDKDGNVIGTSAVTSTLDHDGNSSLDGDSQSPGSDSGLSSSFDLNGLTAFFFGIGLAIGILFVARRWYRARKERGYLSLPLDSEREEFFDCVKEPVS